MALAIVVKNSQVTGMYQNIKKQNKFIIEKDKESKENLRRYKKKINMIYGYKTKEPKQTTSLIRIWHNLCSIIPISVSLSLTLKKLLFPMLPVKLHFVDF